jgi:predicted metal-dependent hydrolase
MTNIKDSSPNVDMRPEIVYQSQDAALRARISAAIETQTGRPIAAETAAAFVEAIDYWFPVLGLFEADNRSSEQHAQANDAHANGEWIKEWTAAIRRCKLRPHTRTVPIFVFGDSVEAERLALDAGADRFMTRAALLDQLPQIIQEAIEPPTVYPEGWDDSLSEKARKGVEEFNRGEFYEQHEWLEHAWMDETRPIRDMYQGVLQVGVAFYHVEQGNWPGALKMFRRGLPRLRALPPTCQGIDIAALRETAEAIHREVTALGRDRLHEFDRSRFPKIRLVDDVGTNAQNTNAQDDAQND